MCEEEGFVEITHCETHLTFSSRVDSSGFILACKNIWWHSWLASFSNHLFHYDNCVCFISLNAKLCSGDTVIVFYLGQPDISKASCNIELRNRFFQSRLIVGPRRARAFKSDSLLRTMWIIWSDWFSYNSNTHETCPRCWQLCLGSSSFCQKTCDCLALTSFTRVRHIAHIVAYIGSQLYAVSDSFFVLSRLRAVELLFPFLKEVLRTSWMLITSSLQLWHFQLFKCCVFIVTVSWCKAVGTKPKHIGNDVCFKIESGFTLVLSVLLNKLAVIQQLTKNV